ncbi:MAG: hypothetical protein FD129_701 [bacterium]|nr:MAG: hypothetical protein FD129_701 [bacterium]
MSHRSNRKGKGSGIFVGVLLLATGAIMLLNQTLDFRHAWRLWPVFMIIVGINTLINRGRRHLFSSVILIGMGVLFLEMNYHMLGLSMRHFAPIVVLIVGLGFIADALERQFGRDNEPPAGGAS